MPKTKLIEGYLEYIRRCDDPNLNACIEKYGEEFLIHSIEAWITETRPEDRDAIPVKDLFRELKSNIMQP
ncbi:MAG: hypothetical protein KAT83_02690 [Candidatus Aenigmarchaeota archaeon]|nr:hypothetical protein [Candidatus Aenigmarchaeota archaeon]